MSKAAGIVATAAVAILVYANGLGGGFVWDDHAIVVENPLVRGPLSPAAILASPYWAARGGRAAAGGLYRPLTVLTYALNRRASPKPFGFRLVNVLLHALASVLVLLLLERLSFSREAALAGGLAFATLPVHVEAVSWIVGRAELLGGALALAAWGLLHEGKRPARLAAGLACYGLALLAKESSAPLPAAWVLGELWRSRRGPKELARERGLFWTLGFGVLALYLAWRGAMLGSALTVGAPYFPERLALTTWLTMAKFFVAGWAFPMTTGLGLCADRARPSFPDAAAGDGAAWSALAALALLAAAALRAFAARRAAWAFGLLVVAAFAAPLSNLLVPMETLGAERIQYLPSVGLCAALAAGYEALRRRRPKAATVAAAAALLWWGGLAAARNRVWAGDEALFTATAACAGENPLVLSGLGVIRDRQGRREEARELFHKALATEPRLGQAAYHLGKSHFDAGDWAAAKPWFESLARAGRADKDTWCYLGLVAEREAKVGEALGHYARALELDSRHPEANFNAGRLLLAMGQSEAGAARLRAYLASGPPEEDARQARALLGPLEREPPRRFP